MPTLSLPANQAKSNVNQRGDLFATLKVKLPTEFTEQELNLFKKLRDLRSKSDRLSDEIDADRNAANDETGKE